MDSFVRMNAIVESSWADLDQVGGTRGALPMKLVWCVKPGGRHKCRAVVCGNFDHRTICKDQDNRAEVLGVFGLGSKERMELGKS